MAEEKVVRQKLNRYSQIIERIFFSRYQKGMREIEFRRDDIETVAAELGIKLPKNLGDVLYSFRYRASLPDSIKAEAPQGEGWIIRPVGRSLSCGAFTISFRVRQGMGNSAIGCDVRNQSARCHAGDRRSVLVR